MSKHDKKNCGTCRDLAKLKAATRDELYTWIMTAETDAEWAKIKRKEAESKCETALKYTEAMYELEHGKARDFKTVREWAMRGADAMDAYKAARESRPKESV
jgi:spore maturation protein CgeB